MPERRRTVGLPLEQLSGASARLVLRAVGYSFEVWVAQSPSRALFQIDYGSGH